MPNPNDETYELPVDFYLKQHDQHVALLRTLQGRGNAYYDEVASLLADMANEYPFNDWLDRERMLGRDCGEDWPEDDDEYDNGYDPDENGNCRCGQCSTTPEPECSPVPDGYVPPAGSHEGFIVLVLGSNGDMILGQPCRTEAEACDVYEHYRVQGYDLRIERCWFEPGT